MTTHASLEMSASARSRTETSHASLDEALGALRDHAKDFARLGIATRVALLRECIPLVQRVARRWVEAAVEAKGLRMDSPAAGEEWLAGPMPTVRNVRLLARSLEDIGRWGKPAIAPGKFSTSRDGRTEVEVFPSDGLDAATGNGIRAKVRMQPGLSESDVREKQASFYGRRDPEGGVSLILGAGNVASIPPMDALYKMFVEGNVCLIKMNPVNEYLGPFYEEAFRPFFDRGYLRLAYGGGDVGGYLAGHAMVDDIHITGSDRTHDLIVWGPPGAERTRRMEANEPLLKKTISSELGCVTPVMIVPGTFTPKELQFLAENVATMVVNNGSFNCNAAKMLVTSKHWPQREEFLGRVREVLSHAALRRAYYPGARDRYETLLRGRDNVVKLGTPGDDQLAWALVFGIDAGASNEALFTTEPFCGILSEVTLDEREPAAFLEAATEFCNTRLWGTLSCSVMIHPDTEKDPVAAAALDSAIAKLRYGGVAINQWAGLIYGTVTPPWGGHPSSTLKDIQGGLGWVHNTFMLEGIEKTVLRGPLTMFPKPPWFITHGRSHEVGRRIVDFEAAPSWLKVPGIALQALRG